MQKTSNLFIINIEFCKSCSTHNWCTHHDQQKYLNTYKKIKQYLQKQFADDIFVQGNVIPQQLVPIKPSQNKYFNTKTNKYVTYPTIGAFEVLIQNELIFSKKKTNTWPNFTQIADKMYQKIYGQQRQTNNQSRNMKNSKQKNKDINIKQKDRSKTKKMNTLISKQERQYNQEQKQQVIDTIDGDIKTQKDNISMRNRSFLDNTDKRSTFYKFKPVVQKQSLSNKNFTLTDHFKNYHHANYKSPTNNNLKLNNLYHQNNNISSDEYFTTANTDNQNQLSQISSFRGGQSSQKDFLQFKKNFDMYGIMQGKLPQFLKKKGYVKQDLGKKQMIIRLDSIQQQSILIDQNNNSNTNNNNLLGPGLYAQNTNLTNTHSTFKSKSKDSHKKLMKRFNDDFQQLQQKFKKFEQKVQTIRQENKKFDSRDSNMSKLNQKMIKELIKKQKKLRNSELNNDNDLLIKQQEDMLDNPIIFARKKLKNIQDYINGTQQQKNQKLKKIYGQWKLLKKPYKCKNYVSPYKIQTSKRAQSKNKYKQNQQLSQFSSSCTSSDQQITQSQINTKSNYQKLPKMSSIKSPKNCQGQAQTQQKFYSTARDKFQQLGNKKLDKKSKVNKFQEFAHSTTQNQFHRASAGMKLNTFDHIAQSQQNENEIEKQYQTYPNSYKEEQALGRKGKGRVLKSLIKSKDKQNFLTKQTSSRGRKIKNIQNRVDEQEQINQVMKRQRKNKNKLSQLQSISAHVDSLQKKSKNFRSKKKQNISVSKSKSKQKYIGKDNNQVNIKQDNSDSNQQKSQNQRSSHQFVEKSSDNAQSLTSNFLKPKAGRYNSQEKRKINKSRVMKNYEMSTGQIKQWKQGEAQMKQKSKQVKTLVNKIQKNNNKNNWRRSYQGEQNQNNEQNKNRTQQSDINQSNKIITSENKLAKKSKHQKMKQIRQKKKFTKTRRQSQLMQSQQQDSDNQIVKQQKQISINKSKKNKQIVQKLKKTSNNRNKANGNKIKELNQKQKQKDKFSNGQMNRQNKSLQQKDSQQQLDYDEESNNDCDNKQQQNISQFHNDNNSNQILNNNNTFKQINNNKIKNNKQKMRKYNKQNQQNLTIIYKQNNNKTKSNKINKNNNKINKNKQNQQLQNQSQYQNQITNSNINSSQSQQQQDSTTNNHINQSQNQQLNYQQNQSQQQKQQAQQCQQQEQNKQINQNIKQQEFGYAKRKSKIKKNKIKYSSFKNIINYKQLQNNNKQFKVKNNNNQKLKSKQNNQLTKNKQNNKQAKSISKNNNNNEYNNIRDKDENEENDNSNQLQSNQNNNDQLNQCLNNNLKQQQQQEMGKQKNKRKKMKNEIIKKNKKNRNIEQMNNNNIESVNSANSKTEQRIQINNGEQIEDMIINGQESKQGIKRKLKSQNLQSQQSNQDIENNQQQQQQSYQQQQKNNSQVNESKQNNQLVQQSQHHQSINKNNILKNKNNIQTINNQNGSNIQLNGKIKQINKNQPNLQTFNNKQQTHNNKQQTNNNQQQTDNNQQQTYHINQNYNGQIKQQIFTNKKNTNKKAIKSNTSQQIIQKQQILNYNSNKLQNISLQQQITQLNSQNNQANLLNNQTNQANILINQFEQVKQVYDKKDKSKIKKQQTKIQQNKSSRIKQLRLQENLIKQNNDSQQINFNNNQQKMQNQQQQNQQQQNQQQINNKRQSQKQTKTIMNNKQIQHNQQIQLHNKVSSNQQKYSNNNLLPVNKDSGQITQRMSNTARSSRSKNNKILNVYDTDRNNQQTQQILDNNNLNIHNQVQENNIEDIENINNQLKNQIKTQSNRKSQLIQNKQLKDIGIQMDNYSLTKSLNNAQTINNKQSFNQNLNNINNNNQQKNHKDSILQKQQPQIQLQSKLSQFQDKLQSPQKISSSLQKSYILQSSSISNNKKQLYQQQLQRQVRIIHAPITKQFYGESFNRQLLKYSNQLQNYKEQMTSPIKQLHSIPLNSCIGLVPKSLISSQPILFNSKSIQVAKIVYNNSINNLIKCIKILSEINQFLIIRLFENPFRKLTNQNIYSTSFGIWLCIDYQWKCIIVNLNSILLTQNETYPYYLHHQNHQLWPILLQTALAKALNGYDKLQSLPCYRIFNILTGSNSLFFNIKQDPTKNSRILRYINDCQNKNFVLHAQKVCRNLQELQNKDKQISIYYVLSQRTVNDNDILIEIKQSCKQQSQWIRLSKFVQQFRSIQILQLRINHNFTSILLPKPYNKTHITIVQLEFNKQSFGSITLSTEPQTSSIIKTYLYKQQKSNLLKLVGQAKQKNKSTLFFDCCFSQAKYYLFVQCGYNARLVYLGENQPILTIIQEVQGEGLKNDWTQYLPVKINNTANNRINQLNFSSTDSFRMPNKLTRSKFGQTGMSFRSQQDKISKLRQNFVINNEQLKVNNKYFESNKTEKFQQRNQWSKLQRVI